MTTATNTRDVDGEIGFHPIADIWPLMQGQELDALVEDIRQYGVREPVWIYKGLILDGRNRYLASKIAGVDCPIREYQGTDPDAFAWSLNAERRHLSESQRSMAAVRRATLKVGDNQHTRGSANFPTLPALTQAEAAKQFRVSDRSIRHAAVVRGSAVPELIEAVERDLIPVSKAASIAKADSIFQADVVRRVRDENLKPTEALRQAKKELVPAHVARLPEGKYRVIYADPPWQYNDSRQTGDHRETTGALTHYADMSLEEMKELDVAALAADDSVLLCWATFPLLEDALCLVKAWGFKYKTAFVWDKGHGAFGTYHDAEAELLFICTRGSCTPDSTTKEKQVHRFARGRHSEKPEQWRGLIDRLWKHGPRIELFRRGTAPDGWSVWGAEAQ